MSEPTEGRPDKGPVDLDEALRQLRRHVEVPPRPDYPALVRRRIDVPPPRRERRRLVIRGKAWHPAAAAAVVGLIVVMATIALPAGRQALANVLEITGVRVKPLPAESVEPRTRLDARLDLGDPVTLAEAQGRVSFAIAIPREPGLTSPDRVYVHTGAGLESVTLVYRAQPGLPGVLGGRVGLLLSEYAGSAEPYFDKYVDRRHPPYPVKIAGSWPGLRFPGRQDVLVLGARGKVYDEHPRVSAPSLVWVRDGVTYRLEADIHQHRALAIAGSVR